MVFSSEKANMRIAKAVEFAGRHKWAKYPCLCSVSLIYASEVLRLKLCSLKDKLCEAAAAPFRPLGGRIVSFILSGAFAFMAVPFSSAAASAEMYVPDKASQDKYCTAEILETEAKTSDTASEDPNNENTLSAPAAPSDLPAERPRIAATPEKIAERVTLAGLAEDNPDYGITLNIRTLKKDVTCRFIRYPSLMPKVTDAFGTYDIPTDNLYIIPLDISLYTTEGKYKLNLSEGYSADITLPVPPEMNGHLDDLKIVRLEDNGYMTVIEGDIGNGKTGKTISFNTEHFSVFALVSYNNGISSENIGSGAGMTASGVSADISVNLSGSIFAEDKNRYKKRPAHKVYRIKRIIKENELLLL